jgi:hypothetical protein
VWAVTGLVYDVIVWRGTVDIPQTLTASSHSRGGQVSISADADARRGIPPASAEVTS